MSKIPSKQLNKKSEMLHFQDFLLTAQGEGKNILEYSFFSILAINYLFQLTALGILLII
jgi:hypothetical protein